MKIKRDHYVLGIQGNQILILNLELQQRAGFLRQNRVPGSHHGQSFRSAGFTVPCPQVRYYGYAEMVGFVSVVFGAGPTIWVPVLCTPSDPPS